MATEQIESELRAILTSQPGLELAILFGSLARGSGIRPDSDLDLAVAFGTPMDAARRSDLTARLAVAFGRPVDLVDLSTVGGALLGQILRHGEILHQSSPGLLGRLYERFLDHQEDFAPAVDAMLTERRRKFLALSHG